MKIQLFSLILGLVCLFPVLSFSFENNPLRTPYPHFDKNKILYAPDRKCPKTPPAIYDMQFKSVYTDKSKGVSIVDKKAQKKYRKQTADIRYFEKKIAGWVEDGLKGGNAIPCAIQWLSDWGKSQSMLNGEVTFQGEAVRKWTLGTLSSHYSQIQKIENIPEKDKEIIEDWLRDLSHQVVKDYNQKPESDSRRNNHSYWAAWSVMMTSVFLDDQKNYRWAKEIFDRAIRDIEPDGTLPLEIARQGKAFNYHVFALSPLIMMAETIEKNGGNGYSVPLHLLVERVLNGLDDPHYFEEKTGVKQNLKGTITSSQLAWIEVYHARFGNDLTQKWIDTLRPFYQRRIGGNITQLFTKNYSDEE